VVTDHADAMAAPLTQVIHRVSVVATAGTTPWLGLRCSCGWYLGYGIAHPLDTLAQSGADHVDQSAKLTAEDIAAITADPFAGPALTGWRAAPDCGKCFDTGRSRWANAHGGTTEGHCSCKRGRRMSEVWRAEKDGQDHPDAYVQEEPDWADEL
jgi:hypothetical protein